MPKNNESWSIIIKNFNGFCPAYFENTYGFYGNKNQAIDMKNIDIIDPNVLTQGPSIVDLTNVASVTTLISAILKTAVTSNVSYAVGGAKIYKFSSTVITNDGTYPMTIDKAGVTGEDADDLIYYQSNIYAFYNHSGSAGDIAKLTLSTDTLDSDWGSTIPTGAGTLESASHYAINGGDDVCYFTNGRYIGTIEDTTLTLQALDFWTNSQVVALTWNHNRVKIGVNRPNVSGSNFNDSGIYTWDGVSSSWEGDPVEVSGEIGALYTKNGIDYCWWKDSASTSGYCFGYINGLRLQLLRRYSGSLPDQKQVGEYEGHIAWISSNKLILWGTKDEDVPVGMKQYMSGKYSTIGTFGTPFGDILISSYEDSNYSFAKKSGYSVDSYWKHLAFDMSGPKYKSQIDLIQVKTKQLSTGAKVDFTLYYDEGKSNKALEQIAYSTSNITLHKILHKGIIVEDFQLYIDFVNGSSTNPVKITGIYILGHFIIES